MHNRDLDEDKEDVIGDSFNPYFDILSSLQENVRKESESVTFDESHRI